MMGLAVFVLDPGLSVFVIILLSLWDDTVALDREIRKCLNKEKIVFKKKKANNALWL